MYFILFSIVFNSQSVAEKCCLALKKELLNKTLRKLFKNKPKRL